MDWQTLVAGLWQQLIDGFFIWSILLFVGLAVYVLFPKRGRAALDRLGNLSEEKKYLLFWLEAAVVGVVLYFVM